MNFSKIFEQISGRKTEIVQEAKKENPLASEETLVQLEEARKKSQEEMVAYDKQKKEERAQEEGSQDLAA